MPAIISWAIAIVKIIVEVARLVREMKKEDKCPGECVHEIKSRLKGKEP